VNRITRIVICIVLFGLSLSACDSVTTSVHASYGVHYGHGYSYAYPGYYPNGRFGPPITMPISSGSQSQQTDLQPLIIRSMPEE